MGISVNIACQLARIAPMLKGKENGIMLGRQKLHFRPAWKARVFPILKVPDISMICPGPSPESYARNSISYMMAAHRYATPQFLFYVVQKNGEHENPPPVIQSHYVNY